MRCERWAVSVVGWLTWVGAGLAVEPSQVFVIVNKNVPESREVADHFCGRRGVPRENQIALDLPDNEDISRADYNAKIVAPLRAALRDRREQARVLLSVYGVPLRVGQATPDAAQQAALDKLTPELAEGRKKREAAAHAVQLLEKEVREHPDSPLGVKMPEKKAALESADKQVQEMEARHSVLAQSETQACVDSELMLLWWDNYPLYRWVVNPLYFRIPPTTRSNRPPVVMTCRLDGPSPSVAMRLVDDAIAAEKTGLQGKAYIDARGIGYDRGADKNGTMYGGYDESFREAAALLREVAHLDVTLDDKDSLFLPGACTDCALYCGWYSLNHYVPCCRFVTGAVAWHLASFEAVSLRKPGTQWCGNLLRDGAAVSLGPVAEPYTIGFPKPAEFFGMLATGEYPLVECYARTTLLTSWMMVLVGDPLYNPYRKTPKLKLADVKPSPKGSQIFPGEQ